jgi:peptidoglycan/xylan/chitin deacetylase (PgdA/CDA1 family)
MRKLAALISAVACLLALAACSHAGSDGEPAASAIRTQKREGAHRVRSAPSRLSGCSSYYALTFDDGPNPVYTAKVKAELDSLGVRATFFLIGEEVDADPALARSLVDDGNWVGNHSYTHPYLTELTHAEVKDQLERTSRAIRAATGGSPEFARPPDGEFNDETLSASSTSSGCGTPSGRSTPTTGAATPWRGWSARPSRSSPAGSS